MQKELYKSIWMVLSRIYILYINSVTWTPSLPHHLQEEINNDNNVIIEVFMIYVQLN